MRDDEKLKYEIELLKKELRNCAEQIVIKDRVIRQVQDNNNRLRLMIQEQDCEIANLRSTFEEEYEEECIFEGDLPITMVTAEELAERIFNAIQDDEDEMSRFNFEISEKIKEWEEDADENDD